MSASAPVQDFRVGWALGSSIRRPATLHVPSPTLRTPSTRLPCPFGVPTHLRSCTTARCRLCFVLLCRSLSNARSLYSSVAERQSCKLKVLCPLPSGGCICPIVQPGLGATVVSAGCCRRCRWRSGATSEVIFRRRSHSRRRRRRTLPLLPVAAPPLPFLCHHRCRPWSP